jgi:hypothetical protein
MGETEFTMAIEISEDGSMIITGEHIQVARLLALRGALKLESKGLKMSRGRSALSIVKELTGLTGTKATMPAKYDAWLTAKGII